MEIGSRRILHFNVTDHPTSEWTLQQFRESIHEKSVKKLSLAHDFIGSPLKIEMPHFATRKNFPQISMVRMFGIQSE
jgi:hypothetical protein